MEWGSHHTVGQVKCLLENKQKKAEIFFLNCAPRKQNKYLRYVPYNCASNCGKSEDYTFSRILHVWFTNLNSVSVVDVNVDVQNAIVNLKLEEENICYDLILI